MSVERTSVEAAGGAPVIGVVGLGTMGLGIAQLYAQAGFAVIATDTHMDARAIAPDRLRAALAARVTAGKLTADDGDRALGRLTVADDVAALHPAALVIEAIVEALPPKRMLFATLERIVSRSAVLATNTSSLAVAALCADLERPERVVGLHFFNPPVAMPLVELVAPDGVDPAALALARSLTEAAGKTVIACADTPGFIVNRCARPFYGEALAMLEEGRTASDIDAAMLAAGYRLGPLSLIDLIGADVHLAATISVFEAMARHPRYRVFDVLRRQVAAGALGRKSGRGFLFPDRPGPPPPDADDIVLRIEAMIANEAATLAASGAVAPSEIDRAMKLGMNWPRGPFEIRDRHGADTVRATLTALAARAPQDLAGRYEGARS